MRQINEKLKEKCGIYIITNINNGNRYVGSSKNMFNRLRDHIWDLQSNRHINSHLQNAWNKYGEENFEYGILCICTEEEKLNKEQFFIDKLSQNIIWMLMLSILQDQKILRKKSLLP